MTAASRGQRAGEAAPCRHLCAFLPGHSRCMSGTGGTLRAARGRCWFRLPGLSLRVRARTQQPFMPSCCKSSAWPCAASAQRRPCADARSWQKPQRRAWHKLRPRTYWRLEELEARPLPLNPCSIESSGSRDAQRLGPSDAGFGRRPNSFPDGALGLQQRVVSWHQPTSSPRLYRSADYCRLFSPPH